MCHYAQNGWWTYEICWPWHVRRLHFYTTNDPDAQILREFTDEDGSSTVITGATRTELGANGGIIGFFGNGGRRRKETFLYLIVMLLLFILSICFYRGSWPYY